MNLTKLKLIEQVDNLKLYRIQGNIGWIKGQIEIDFSKNFINWIELGGLYKVYGRINIPEAIYSKIRNPIYQMVTTYILNSYHHSVIFHNMAGGGITLTFPPNTAGVWTAEINFIAPLI